MLYLAYLLDIIYSEFMFFLVAFIWGGIGGILVDLLNYRSKILNGDYENMYDTFKKNHLIPIIISFIIGGIIPMALSFQIAPSEVWFIITGLGANSLISRWNELRQHQTK